MNHKQIAWWTLTVLIVTSLLSLCCTLFFPQFLLCTLLLSILWNLLFACMLYSIHHTTCALSDQLMKIYTGHEEIDLYDQQEGVFSILKNDIYKLIRTYYEQKEQSLRVSNYSYKKGRTLAFCEDPSHFFQYLQSSIINRLFYLFTFFCS